MSTWLSRILKPDKQSDDLSTVLPQLLRSTPDPMHDRIAESAFSQAIESRGNNPQRWPQIVAEDHLLRTVFPVLFKDQIVLDLGAGVNWRDTHNFVKSLGARKYIGVDKYFADLNTPAVEIPDATCPGLLLKMDMLYVANRIQDSSCCVIADAIDGAVIVNQAYHQALAEQIQRIVPKGKVAMGTISYPLSLIIAGEDNAEQSDTNGPTFFLSRAMVHCFADPQPSANWLSISKDSADRILVRK